MLIHQRFPSQPILIIQSFGDQVIGNPSPIVDSDPQYLIDAVRAMLEKN